MASKQRLLDLWNAGLKREDTARAWRDAELRRTDPIVQIPDHSKRDSFIEYRQLLRDWPSTEDFPATQPVRTE